MFIRVFMFLLIFISFVNKELQAAHNRPKKLAFLFLTRQAPNHPNLWQYFFENSQMPWSLYIHSASEINHPFFSQFRVNKIVPTSWSIHVKAWQVLIQEALKDKSNTHFAFLSEACIPLYPLDHIHKTITEDPRSHMAYAGPWWPSTSTREVLEIFSEFRKGNTEWMVLNRKHAEIVAKDRAIIRIISRHDNDQESYFASLFAIHGCLDEICNHTYTYVNWKNPVNGGMSPYSFGEDNDFNENLIEEAYGEGYLFARKFSVSYPEDFLFKMIYNRS